jgi:hypothetical protein
MTTGSQARPLSRIFAMPLLRGGLSAIGLIAALVGDDAWDVAGWLTLGVPLVVVGWCLARSRGGPGGEPAPD